MMHRLVNPDTLLPPVGFAHGVLAAPGRTLYLGGQTGHYADGSLDAGLVDQFARALDNLVTVLAAAGSVPEDLVSVHVYVTDADAYHRAATALGSAWRAALGRHYPAMALFEVARLYDPEAVVELVAIAVLPDGR